MKLELNFPVEYTNSTNKINTIKAVRRLFSIDLIEAKAVSEMNQETYIKEVKFKPLESEVEGQEYHINQLITILRNSGEIGRAHV